MGECWSDEVRGSLRSVCALCTIVLVKMCFLGFGLGLRFWSFFLGLDWLLCNLFGFGWSWILVLTGCYPFSCA